MLLEKDLLEILLSHFPEFKESDQWKNHQEFWRDGHPTIQNAIVTFSLFVLEILSVKTPCIKPIKIFSFVEQCMVEGDQQVKQAMGVGLLENLLNYYTWDTLPSLEFVRLLGPVSRNYCKGWGKFTSIEPKEAHIKK